MADPAAQALTGALVALDASIVKLTAVADSGLVPPSICREIDRAIVGADRLRRDIRAGRVTTPEDFGRRMDELNVGAVALNGRLLALMGQGEA